MQINLHSNDKTEFMLIGSNNRLVLITNSPKITIDGKEIKRVPHKKTLGLIIDKHLNFDEQCKKISVNIALIRRAKSFLSQNELVIMYNALVLPYFTYCSTVWSDGRYTHIDKLSKLQKRAAQVITGDKYEVRSIEIFDKLRWLPIDTILKSREIVFTFKALTKRLPKYMFELFNKCNNTNYNLRSNNTKLSLPKPKTNFLKRSFPYRATKSWNELPNEITENYQTLTLLFIKRHLKNLI